MLVLSRKTEEKIHIGDKITITVVRIKGQIVKLGIDAPRDMRVRRGEHVDADVQSDPGGTEDAVQSTHADPGPDSQ